MPTMDVTALIHSALGRAELPLKEQELTACLAQCLDGLGHEVWGTNYRPATALGVVNPDLGWAASGGVWPEHVLQVKTGGRHQEDQEVYEFLNDVLYAAYDDAQAQAGGGSRPPRSCIAVLHNNEEFNKKFWPVLRRMQGRCVLMLKPAQATADKRPDIDLWLKPSVAPCIPHRITPFTRTQLSQIFSGTQKATYVNLFRRPGHLYVHVDAEVVSAGPAKAPFDVLVWRIEGARLLGADLSLQQWVP